MDSSSSFEEIEDFLPNSLLNLYQNSTPLKKTSDTVSTSNCTLDQEKQLFIATPIRKKSLRFDGSLSCKSINKYIDLADRLNSFKQITENKIKFMRVEKEIKELSSCTFKPKTNRPVSKAKTTNFSKKQEEYLKNKNSKIIHLKMQYSATNSSCSMTPLLGKTTKKPENKVPVHERLYKDSRMISKNVKYRKHID